MVLGNSWWQSDEPHIALGAGNASIFRTATVRQQNFRLYYQQYVEGEIDGVGPYQYWSQRNAAFRRLTYNVIRSIIDTIQAKTCQSIPRPMVLTSGADWSLRQRAKKLTQWLDGLFFKCNVDETSTAVCLDALLFGVGFWLPYLDDTNQIQIERVFPGELYVDEIESFYRKPRSLYRSQMVDRAQLMALYPERKSEIETCAPSETYGASDTSFFGESTRADVVTVTEAWHLPSSAGSKDGRHVRVIQNATLLDEEYTQSEFPVVCLRYSPAPAGYWGIGIAERLLGIQREINETLAVIVASQRLISAPRVFINRGANVNTNRLNNELGAIIEYDGQPPTFFMPQAASPELYNHLETLMRRAYEIEGVSQLAAQSQKPAGLNSGEALRVYNDVQSERFILFGKAFERAHVELAEKMIALAKYAAEQDSAIDVVYRSKTGVQRIDWRDVDIEDSEFVVQTYPVSALPKSPAGRMAALQDWVNSGLIPLQDAQRLTELPDLDSEFNLLNSPRDLIEKRLEAMVDRGEYYPPEPFYNLELALGLTTNYLQLCEINGVPEDRLALLREFAAACSSLLTEKQPPPPPMPPMPEGPPTP